ncbi:hypothetical protein [Sulfurovum sp.]|uniref:hypothetical protein n=1 Tax=Sulfurovum sp. TaxID=1969726 RepID=UPI00286800DE|nr:hypothetical protein [Sulfurovum sp.]
MKNRKVICHECKEPILTKDDLAVVGNSFITYHNACFEKIKHKNIYAFYSGYKTNGIFPWIMLIILNSAIWGTFYFFHAPIDEVITFSAFISSVILFLRLMSYLLYERHF